MSNIPYSDFIALKNQVTRLERAICCLDSESGTPSNGASLESDSVVLGDSNEGVTEAGVFTSDRILNQDGFTLIHAADNRVATGVSAGATVRSIIDLELGSDITFNEIIGTTDNAGVGAPNNFTYYRSFNLDTTGALIDPTKHGWGDGYEYHYEPVAGQVYAEKHTVLNIGGTTYRIDSHTLPINTPASWSLYHTLTTWFLRSPIDDGPYAEFSRVSASQSQLSLLASGQTQKGASFFLTQDGTNVSLQINPLGAATEKSFSVASWQDASLPAFVSYNYPPFGAGAKQNHSQGAIYPVPDNTHSFGATNLRWSDIFGCALQISDPGDNTNIFFEVFDAGNTHAQILSVGQVNNASGLAHGTYLPSANDQSNITSLTMRDAQYMRVGNTVTISGSFDAENSGSGETRFSIDLPIPSAFADEYQASGVAVGTGEPMDYGRVFSVGPDAVRIKWLAPDSNMRTWSYHFTYLVV